MEERVKPELEEAMRALAVLDQAFYSCNFSGLVVVTDDPAYRSNLTSFTVEHAGVQTIALFHYYRELTCHLAEELEYIGGPPGTIKSCSSRQRAVKVAMDVGRISQATVYIWKKDVCDNGFRFSESLNS